MHADIREEDLVAWHDAECGSYADDLPLWRRLAQEAVGPVWDLGCGTGRVALDLASHDVRVVGVDSEPVFLAELESRAAEVGVDGLVSTLLADVVAIGEAGSAFRSEPAGAVLAPMQLVQVVGGAAARASLLSGVPGLLAPGGIAAFAICEPADVAPALEVGEPGEPDAVEYGGRRWESRAIGVRRVAGGFEVERVRSRPGHSAGTPHTDRFHELTAEALAVEARAAGLEPVATSGIPGSDVHVGSTVLVVRRPGEVRR